VNLLVDTHIWLWLIDPKKSLPAAIRATVTSADNTLWLSPVSVWEAAVKSAAGKLPLPDTPRASAELFLKAGAQALPLTIEHAAMQISDPPTTKDPFDRLLLAQCEASAMRLVTADDRLKDHRLAWKS
jgi:PIN domain nuclease of toxin-antitoxin system